MPWTNDAPPNVAANWTPDEQRKCVTAANAVVYDDKGSEEDAIFACIRAAGKSSKAMTADELATITAAEELKAGRRLQGGQVQALRTALDALQSILKWADYDDNPGNTHYKEKGPMVRMSKALEAKAQAMGASLTDYVERVRKEWMTQFDTKDGDGNRLHDRWIREVYENAVVVSEENGSLMSYPYTVVGGEFTFGSPFPVRQTYLPASKALTEIKSTAKGIVIGSHMLLWGDEKNPHDRDLQEDYFTPTTRLYLDHYAKAPALFHHGMDGRVGKAVMGYRDDARKDADGLWVQDWLDKSSKFWHLVKPLLEAKKLYYSPGSVPHLVQREPTGQLKTYPIVDDTFTVTPVQIHLQDRPLDYVKAAYKEAGLTWSLPEELRGTSPQNGDVTSADRARQLAQAKLTILQLRS